MKQSLFDEDERGIEIYNDLGQELAADVKDAIGPIIKKYADKNVSWRDLRDIIERVAGGQVITEKFSLDRLDKR